MDHLRPANERGQEPNEIHHQGCELYIKVFLSVSGQPEVNSALRETRRCMSMAKITDSSIDGEAHSNTSPFEV